MREHINIGIAIFSKNFYMNPDISLYKSLVVLLFMVFFINNLSVFTLINSDG
jgi:hypothetical protein